METRRAESGGHAACDSEQARTELVWDLRERRNVGVRDDEEMASSDRLVV